MAKAIRAVTLLTAIMYQGTVYGPGPTEIPEDIADELIEKHDAYVGTREESLPKPPVKDESGDAMIIRAQNLALCNLTEIVGGLQTGIANGRWSLADVRDELERQDLIAQPVASSPAKPVAEKPSGDVAAPIENRVKEETPAETPKPAARRTAAKKAEAPADPPKETATETPTETTPPATSTETTTDLTLPPAVIKNLVVGGFNLSKPETVTGATDEQLLAVEGVTPEILTLIRNLTK